jgi:M6 family metalloprotease-like protein
MKINIFLIYYIGIIYYFLNTLTKTLKLKFFIFLNTILILGLFSFPVFASDTQDLVSRINTLTTDILKINTPIVNSLGKQSVLGTQSLQVEKSIERKDLMKELMIEDPTLFNSMVMKSSDRDNLPSGVQDNIEQQSTIFGKITTIAIDNINKTSSYMYYINTLEKQYSFYPTSDTPLLSSTDVEVTGYTLDNQLSANTTNNPLVILGTEPYADSTGDQKTLFILVKSFSGDSEPFTPAQAKDLVFSGQFQNFMQEQSYNKVSFSGDVYGWVSVGQDLSSVSPSYFFSHTLTNNFFQSIVNTYNIDIAKYDHVAYLVEDIGGGVSSVGKTFISVNDVLYSLSNTVIGLDGYSLPSSWGVQPFTWKNLDYLLSHELGHAIGVVHANSWLCTDGQILYGNCSHHQYGNWYDTMGTTSYSLNYNAYFKEKLGWIPDSQMQSITSSGTYTINPLEVSDSIKLGAKIYIPDRTPSPYYLELRKALGFDLNLNNTNPNLTNNQNGLFVNYIRGNNNPELLDMSPADDLKNVTLNLPSAGTSVSSFTDSETGVTIGPVLSVSDSAISFKVNFTAITPIATPTSGTYSETQTVSLDSPQSTYIRYTTDGSTPSCTVGTIYSTPIIVSSSETITAVGCDSLDAPSSVATFAYVINYAPIVSDIIISGTPTVGQILTGSYTYTDQEGDIQGTSTFRWLRNDVAISSATSLTYTTTVDDAGKTIKFEVTPIALTGITNGLVVQSIGVSIPAIAPIIVTNSASSIAQTSVTLNANITSTGGDPIIVSGFKYGLTTDYTTTTIDGPTTTGVFSKNIIDLTCNTIYHYLSYATNSVDTTLSDDQTFTTSACTDPNIALVSSDKSSLIDSIILNQNQDLSHIITSLTLPTSGLNGSTISWSSDNISVVSNTGVVTRPAYGQLNVRVNITATLTKGEVTDIKLFNLLILADTVNPNPVSSGGSGGGTSSYTPPPVVKPIVVPIITTPIVTKPEITPTTLPKEETKTTPSITFTKVLKINSKGTEVKQLQSILIKNKYLSGKADGIFGKQTKLAIMKFQKDHNLKQDGIVGPKTLKEMK